MVCGLSSIPVLSLRLSLPVDEAILAADTPPFFSLDYKPRDAVHLHQFLGVNKDPTVAQSGVKMPSFFGYIVYSCVFLLPILAAMVWIFLR